MDTTKTYVDPEYNPDDEPFCYSWDVALMLPVPMRVVAAWDLVNEILEPHGIVIRVMGASGNTQPGPSMGLGEMTPERWSELSKYHLAAEPFDGFVEQVDKGSEA